MNTVQYEIISLTLTKKKIDVLYEKIVHMRIKMEAINSRNYTIHKTNKDHLGKPFSCILCVLCVSQCMRKLDLIT